MMPDGKFGDLFKIKLGNSQCMTWVFAPIASIYPLVLMAHVF